MRYANHIELQRDMQQMAREARDLAAKARKLEAENKRLRKALEPMTKGTLGDPEAPIVEAYVEGLEAEVRRLRDALATESGRKCASEHDCVWQPHCAHAGKCMRPERPAGA